jgi:hypothetical protein
MMISWSPGPTVEPISPSQVLTASGLPPRVSGTRSTLWRIGAVERSLTQPSALHDSSHGHVRAGTVSAAHVSCRSSNAGSANYGRAGRSSRPRSLVSASKLPIIARNWQIGGARRRHAGFAPSWHCFRSRLAWCSRSFPAPPSCSSPFRRRCSPPNRCASRAPSTRPKFGCALNEKNCGRSRERGARKPAVPLARHPGSSLSQGL